MADSQIAKHGPKWLTMSQSMCFERPFQLPKRRTKHRQTAWCATSPGHLLSCRGWAKQNSDVRVEKTHFFGVCSHGFTLPKYPKTQKHIVVWTQKTEQQGLPCYSFSSFTFCLWISQNISKFTTQHPTAPLFLEAKKTTAPLAQHPFGEQKLPVCHRSPSAPSHLPRALRGRSPPRPHGSRRRPPAHCLVVSSWVKMTRL